MKTYKIIDDALYEIASQRIARRRRNPTAALVVLVAGLLLLGSVYYADILGQNVILARIVTLTGLLAVFAGVVKSVIDFSSRGKLYYKPSGSEIRRYELIFDTPYAMKVCEALAEGDLAALSGIPKGRTSSLKAVIYKTTDNGIIMTQAFEAQKPLTEPRIFEEGNFTLLGRLA